MQASGKPATAPLSALRAIARAVTWRGTGIAIVIAVLVAVALNPIFITAFPILLGRTVAVAVLLLLAFKAAGAWQPPGVPRWLAQTLAVVIAAPLATLLVYLPTAVDRGTGPLHSAGHEAESKSGQQADPMHDGSRIAGIVLISGTAMVIAPLLALGALYRERDSQARNEQLSFALERSTFEKQALDARLKLLNAQIAPHFLFNTLANIQELVESGSTQAAPVLKSLIAYLRAAMPKLHEATATLADEVALVRAYLDLMLMRMPDRLRFAIDVPAELGAMAFPPMGLLTLVENAIRHGIDPSEAGGRIDVVARREGRSGAVRIRVADTGAGLGASARPGTGIENLRGRLRAFFGAGAELELHENVPHGLRAEIIVAAGDSAAPTLPA